jgi:hypothetical protein
LRGDDQRDARGGEVHRDALGLDDAAWLRGRGRALQPSISAMVYYAETAPERAEGARHTVERILADARR